MPPAPTTPPSASHFSAVLITIVLAIVLVAAALGFALSKGYLSLPKTKAADTAAQETKKDTSDNSIPAGPYPTLGAYALVGRSAGQSGTYSGTVTIAARVGTQNTFDLSWALTSGQGQLGVGVLRGDILSVSYYETLEDGTIQDVGAISYQIKDSSHLSGEWASVKGGTTGIEELTLQPQI